MPPSYPVDRNAVPKGLTAQDHWVCWQYDHRDGTPTKVPLDPATDTYASVSDPATWTGFAEAYQSYNETAVDGIGFVFSTEDPFVGIDLDACRDPASGKLADWAKDIITRLNSYTEASPSGTGVHVIAAGERPPGKNRNSNVECYDADRYFTVTGRHLSLTPRTVNDRTEELASLHEEYITDTTTDDVTQWEPAPTGNLSDDDLSDEDLIEYALNASNGDKFERLWNGDTSGYKSHSEADQALCNLLAFWTGGDPRRVERLFTKSDLVRDKWRTRRDYREQTIRKAIRDSPIYSNNANQ